MKWNKYFYIWVLLLITLNLRAQKPSPQFGVGVSANTISRYDFKFGFIDHYLMPQLHFIYKPNGNNIFSLGVGKLYANTPVIDPIWINIDYLRIVNSGKRNYNFIYGGQATIAIGEFAYASEFKNGRFEEYFKRFLVGLSPQAGILINTSKRSYIAPTISVGAAMLLSKITQAPASSGSSDRIQVPLNFRVQYGYLF